MWVVQKDFMVNLGEGNTSQIVLDGQKIEFWGEIGMSQTTTRTYESDNSYKMNFMATHIKIGAFWYETKELARHHFEQLAQKLTAFEM